MEIVEIEPKGESIWKKVNYHINIDIISNKFVINWAINDKERPLENIQINNEVKIII